jgi:hypothetical protein
MVKPLSRREALGLMVAGGALWLFGSRRAHASMAVGIGLPELFRKSSRVAFSTSLEAFSRWEQLGGTRRIVTYHRLRVDEPIAGPAADPELMVRTLGGRVGDIGQIVHGEAALVVGEPCLLFLRTASDGVYAVAEHAQGHYPLRDDGRGKWRLRSSPRLGPLAEAEGSAVRALVGRSREEAVTLLHEVRRGQK